VDREYVIEGPNAKRTQKYHFRAGRVQYVPHGHREVRLGVNTAQMNKDHDYGGAIANQLSTLEHLGIFDRSCPSPWSNSTSSSIRATTRPTSTNGRDRICRRNCSHCHRKWGGGNAEFQLLYTLPSRRPTRSA